MFSWYDLTIANTDRWRPVFIVPSGKIRTAEITKARHRLLVHLLNYLSPSVRYQNRNRCLVCHHLTWHDGSFLGWLYDYMISIVVALLEIDVNREMYCYAKRRGNIRRFCEKSFLKIYKCLIHNLWSAQNFILIEIYSFLFK